MLEDLFMYTQCYEKSHLKNCLFSKILARGKGGRTSWRNKLVNCGDKIQVGTVTVNPLYFIGLNDQGSLDDTAV